MKRNQKGHLGILSVSAAACILCGVVLPALFAAAPVKAASKEAIDVTGIEPFTGISVTSDTGNFVLEEGKDFSFHVSENYHDTVSYELKNHTFTVVTENPDKGASTNIEKWTITITVPAGTTMADVTVNLAMGGMEISDLSAEKASLNAAMGSIDTDGCDLGDTKAGASMGSITFTDCTGGSLDIDAAMGSITLNKADFDDVNAKASMGSIEISHKVDVKTLTLDLETSMGTVTVGDKSCGTSYTQSGTSGKSVKANTAMGSVTVR